MNINVLIVFTLCIFIASCSKDAGLSLEEMKTQLEPMTMAYKDHSDIDFYDDIKPIIDAKCISCHACYDAPCQLKMESLEGLQRGGSKFKVYNAKRIENQQPTRLGIDAHTTSQWREKGFNDVLSNVNGDDSIMQKMLILGKAHPIPEQTRVTPKLVKLGVKRETSCIKQTEFNDYISKKPYGGMPLAVAGLTDNEFQKMSQWLNSGAKVEPKKYVSTPEQKAQIKQWESWLNKKNDEQKLLSRYIYEHLILGNLYLSSDDVLEKQLQEKKSDAIFYYKLVRSATAPGKPVSIISTPLPNDPYQGEIFYRLVPVTESIVYKNHIPYRLDSERFKFYNALFYAKPWRVGKLPSYNYADRANPFQTFLDIPAKARYEFLLKDAKYFIRNFIRGPVCHGPIATDVIRDQFWTMFESPKYEQYVNDKTYRERVTPHLGLPGEKTDLSDLGEQWKKYKNKRNNYLSERDKHYNQVFSKGAHVDHIWNGNQNNTNAFLTIFRHHDNASVTQGWKGDYPLTAWVLDYPLFERTYYELVVGFNVFGSVSHQLQTRLYFDLIRNGGEVNFLRFMPSTRREYIYASWYEGLGSLKKSVTYHPINKTAPVDITYKNKNVKKEFLDFYFSNYPDLTRQKDDINRCEVNCIESDNFKNSLAKLTRIKTKQLPVIEYFPEVTLLNIQKNSAMETFTIIRNRMHSNVAFMLGESLRHKKNKDTLSILPEVLGSYPNLMFSVKEQDVDKFVSSLEKVDSQEAFNLVVDQYGIRRMNPQFWEHLHNFSRSISKTLPIEAGVLDINRYGYW